MKSNLENIDLQPLLTTKKILEKVLMSKGVEVYSPKKTFRKAAAEGLIREFEIWGEKYLETRNLTVHTYEADILKEV